MSPINFHFIQPMKSIILFVCLFVVTFAKLCPDHSSCNACASATGCKWCPVDKKVF
jgi:hypothetical protein